MDLRGSKSDLSITETFFMGSADLPKVTEKSFEKVAIVEDVITDKMRFFEDVVVNRGYKVKFFLELQEAEEWIRAE